MEIQKLEKFEQKYVIVLTDRTEIVIDENTRNKILYAIDDLKAESVMINGNYYKTWLLGKIITIAEYYKNNPDRIPAPTSKDITIETMTYHPIIGQRMIKGIVKGLESYIDSPQYQGTDKSIKLLKIYKDRLKSYENIKKET